MFKVLTWAGIIALVSVPLMVFLKRNQTQEAPSGDDESDIFEAELKG
jgi:hypothetical protein